ncbi:MAG TPA: hypothetical protein PK722_06325 [Kiritimatiellia bacterium]|nr:hypothetical protein [Kiritimatiellia bacterium]
MLENILVAVIVGLALGFIIRGVIRRARGKDSLCAGCPMAGRCGDDARSQMKCGIRK